MVCIASWQLSLDRDEMPNRSILQIVSGFKPSADGMGDFARRLGMTLWQRNNLRSHFVVYRTPSKPFDSGQVHPNTLSYAAEPSASALIEEVDRLQRQQKFDCVLLHYGPYAYSRTGEPLEFVHEMADIAVDSRLLVFFHELYASGMPWQRAFWTNRQQRESVGQLLSNASVGFSSNAKYMQRLDSINKNGCDLIKIPIFSNIGEPEGLRPLRQRSRQMVIFGQLVTRNRLYREHRRLLENMCRTLRIEKVIDVGSGHSPNLPAALGGAQVRSTGWMDEDQLSELMADSIAGVVGYWPDVWEKSGIIAAYQAHALVPILVELEPRNIPAPPYLPYVLAESISSFVSRDGSTSDAGMQQIADAAHAYYMRHQSVQCCADVIMNCTNADE
jgi:hypothetical protein